MSGKGYKRAPVKETCPDIDKVISQIEELREANAQLRKWGAEEADRVDELEADLEAATDTISELQDEIENLKSELAEAHQERA